MVEGTVVGVRNGKVLNFMNGKQLLFLPPLTQFGCLFYGLMDIFIIDSQWGL